MSDRTQGSDTAHLRLWHNQLPNEEQVEQPKKSSMFFIKYSV